MQPSLAAFTCFSLCAGLSAHLYVPGRQLQRAAGVSQRLVFVHVHLQHPSLLGTAPTSCWTTLAAAPPPAYYHVRAPLSAAHLCRATLRAAHMEATRRHPVLLSTAYPQTNGVIWPSNLAAARGRE